MDVYRPKFGVLSGKNGQIWTDWTKITCLDYMDEWPNSSSNKYVTSLELN